MLTALITAPPIERPPGCLQTRTDPFCLPLSSHPMAWCIMHYSYEGSDLGIIQKDNSKRCLAEDVQLVPPGWTEVEDELYVPYTTLNWRLLCSELSFCTLSFLVHYLGQCFNIHNKARYIPEQINIRSLFSEWAWLVFAESTALLQLLSSWPKESELPSIVFQIWRQFMNFMVLLL